MKDKKLWWGGLLIFISLGLLFVLGWSNQATSIDYDLLIKNARVVDGTLRTPYRADVAVKGEVIVKVARRIKGKAKRVIDARGLYLTPGFIDLHTHVDRGMYFPENRACLNYLKQGVTTVVVGQCGGSAWPIFEKAEDQIKRWSQEGIGPNAALLIGHGTVRRLVMGDENRDPTPEELEKMKALVREAMEQGACGMSTGLIYLPGRFAKTEEIIELAKVVASYGGIYHTHIRNERDKLLEAVKEAIEIAEKAGIRTNISHFKVMGRKNWGLVRQACQLIEEARARGLKISADQYPFRFSSGYPYRSLIPTKTWRGERVERLTNRDIDNLFGHLSDQELIDLYRKTTPYVPFNEHHWQFLKSLSRERLVRYIGRSILSTSYFQGPENPRERMFFYQRLQNPEEAARIYQEVENYIEDLVGAENFVVGVCVEKQYEGKSIKEIAALRKESVGKTAVALEMMGAKCIPLQMCEEDIEYIMKKDWVATSSDGLAPFYGIGLTHIRSYSTFLHKIKKYVLTRKTISLAHAIRSQTALSADIMGWPDRGRIKEGCKADLVLLDLKNIRIKTSISNPHQYSEGVRYLVINGQMVIDNGRYTGKLPGQVLLLKKGA